MHPVVTAQGGTMAMCKFELAAKVVDAKFNEIMGADSDVEQASVMLLRAAAKMVITTYPAHRLRALALANLLSSTEHLKALEKIGGNNP